MNLNLKLDLDIELEFDLALELALELVLELALEFVLEFASSDISRRWVCAFPSQMLLATRAILAPSDAF